MKPTYTRSWPNAGLHHDVMYLLGWPRRGRLVHHWLRWDDQQGLGITNAEVPKPCPLHGECVSLLYSDTHGTNNMCINWG